MEPAFRRINFSKVTDKSILARLPKESAANVMQVDLKAMGITSYGAISKGTWTGKEYVNEQPAPELFFNGKPMTIARYPNDGFTKIVEVKDSGSVYRNWWDNKKDTASYVKPEDRPNPPIGGTFIYDGDRPKRWKYANDIWMRGFWGADWYDELLAVKTIDTIKKTIVTEHPSKYGFNVWRKVLFL